MSVLNVSVHELQALRKEPTKILNYPKIRIVKSESVNSFSDPLIFNMQNIITIYNKPNYGVLNYIVPIRSNVPVDGKYVYDLIVIEQKVEMDIDGFPGEIIECHGSKCRQRSRFVYCLSCNGQMDQNFLQEIQPRVFTSSDNYWDIHVQENCKSVDVETMEEEEFVSTCTDLLESSTDEKSTLDMINEYNKAMKIIDSNEISRSTIDNLQDYWYDINRSNRVEVKKQSNIDDLNGKIEALESNNKSLEEQMEIIVKAKESNLAEIAKLKLELEKTNTPGYAMELWFQV